MKTKEINTWIYKNKDIDMCDHLTIKTQDPLSDNYYKAKLIIEIPEKKIEITESQLEKAYKRAYGRVNKHEAHYFNLIKKELGF
jgi:hypothetical protein